MRCLFKTGALRSGAYHRSPGFHSTPQLDNWHESTDNKISLNKIRRYVEQLIVMQCSGGFRGKDFWKSLQTMTNSK